MLVGRIIPTRSYDLPLRVGEEERSGYMWSMRPEDLYADGTQHCIAKKLKRAGPLVRMTPEELMLCDGDDGEDWFNEAWCAVKDMVYNMTCKPLRIQPPFIQLILRSGRSIQQRAMGRRPETIPRWHCHRRAYGDAHLAEVSFQGCGSPNGREDRR